MAKMRTPTMQMGPIAQSVHTAQFLWNGISKSKVTKLSRELSMENQLSLMGTFIVKITFTTFISLIKL